MGKDFIYCDLGDSLKNVIERKAKPLSRKRVEWGSGNDAKWCYTGDTREKVMFALFPKKVGGEWIWLEKYISVQESYFFYIRDLDEWNYEWYWKSHGLSWKEYHRKKIVVDN